MFALWNWNKIGQIRHISDALLKENNPAIQMCSKLTFDVFGTGSVSTKSLFK